VHNIQKACIDATRFVDWDLTALSAQLG